MKGKRDAKCPKSIRKRIDLSGGCILVISHEVKNGTIGPCLAGKK
jgi:hypothetical protein